MRRERSVGMRGEGSVEVPWWEEGGVERCVGAQGRVCRDRQVRGRGSGEERRGGSVEVCACAGEGLWRCTEEGL